MHVVQRVGKRPCGGRLIMSKLVYRVKTASSQTSSCTMYMHVGIIYTPVEVLEFGSSGIVSHAIQHSQRIDRKLLTRPQPVHRPAHTGKLHRCQWVAQQR